MPNHPLNSELLASFASDFRDDRTARIVQNAVAETAISKVAINRDVVNSIDPSMSVRVDKWPITNQKRSGRCWLFAGLNSLKPAVYKQTKLESFEFSQNYQHFWDKLEKANYFLTSMIDLADRPLDDRTVHYLLLSHRRRRSVEHVRRARREVRGRSEVCDAGDRIVLEHRGDEPHA